MINEKIKTEIMTRLHKAEQEYDVTILLAVESGSRAWGFASPNSDYDVRFIYVHNRDWYLSVDLEEQRDVIEYPIVDDIDLNGWDLRKACKLFRQSNPTLVEWLKSPITYIEKGVARSELLMLLKEYYASHKGIHHYLNMAKTNYRKYLCDEMVSLKKYFYVLRPLLAVRWIEQFREPAPIEFATLLKLITEDDFVREEIDLLLERKAAATEKEMIPGVDILNQFIERELERVASSEIISGGKSGVVEELNRVFRGAVE